MNHRRAGEFGHCAAAARAAAAAGAPMRILDAIIYFNRDDSWRQVVIAALLWLGQLIGVTEPLPPIPPPPPPPTLPFLFIVRIPRLNQSITSSWVFFSPNCFPSPLHARPTIHPCHPHHLPTPRLPLCCAIPCPLHWAPQTPPAAPRATAESERISCNFKH